MVLWPFVSKEDILYFKILKYKQLCFFWITIKWTNVVIGQDIVKNEILRNLCNNTIESLEQFCIVWFFLPEPGTLSEKEIQKNRLIFYRKPLLNNIAIKSFQSNGSLKTCVVKYERNATCLKDKTAMVEKRQVLVWAVVAAASNY